MCGFWPGATCAADRRARALTSGMAREPNRSHQRVAPTGSHRAACWAAKPRYGFGRLGTRIKVDLKARLRERRTGLVDGDIRLFPPARTVSDRCLPRSPVRTKTRPQRRQGRRDIHKIRVKAGRLHALRRAVAEPAMMQRKRSTAPDRRITPRVSTAGCSHQQNRHKRQKKIFLQYKENSPIHPDHRPTPRPNPCPSWPHSQKSSWTRSSAA